MRAAAFVLCPSTSSGNTSRSRSTDSRRSAINIVGHPQNAKARWVCTSCGPRRYSPSLPDGIGSMRQDTDTAQQDRKYDVQQDSNNEQQDTKYHVQQKKQIAEQTTEQEAKREAEQEAKRKADQEAKRKADQEAKRKAEQEAKRNLFYDVELFLGLASKALHNTGISLLQVATQWDAVRKSGREPRYEYKDYSGGENGKLPKMVNGLPKGKGFTSEMIGDLASRVYEYVMSQMPFVARIRQKNISPDFRHENSMWKDLPMKDIFRSVFDTKDYFIKPKYLADKKDWCDVEDEVFTSQFVNGCHPLTLEFVDCEEKFKKIPAAFHSIRSEDNFTIDELRKDNRLFIADYEILSRAGVAESQCNQSGAYTRTFVLERPDGIKIKTKYFYAPFLVFYRDERSRKLRLLGIMLNRENSGCGEIYSRKLVDEGKRHTYMFAKMHVACSDNQLHQFASHLAGHLIWEAFGVAHQNVFVIDRNDLDHKNKNHVVGRLLSEHFEGTIAINWLARETLIASREEVTPMTDATFAVGSEGAGALLGHAYNDWDFQKSAFPDMMKARGLDLNSNRDGLNDFYYRDDGKKIWEALERYVRRVINYSYGRGPEGDEKVRLDSVLKEWIRELRENAKVKTFPEHFGCKEDLIKAVTTIMFHVSAQHAALNFAQWEYLSYVPNRPNSLFKPVASVKEPNMDRDTIFQIENLEGAAQPLTFMHFQVQFAYLLSTPPKKTLMSMNSPFRSAYEQLKWDLQQLHDVIDKRKSRPEYRFLDPYQIPPSINI